MDPDSVRIRLQEIGLNDDQIEEVLPLLSTEQTKPADDSGLLSSTAELTIAIQNEPDWRKRAALSAKIISLSIDA